MTSAVLVSLCLVTACERKMRVGTGSMEPTFSVGDTVSCSDLPAGAPLTRGQIVVIQSPEGGDSHWIRRVVGLPGETVEIRNAGLIVDGKTHDWLSITGASPSDIRREQAPTLIPADHYYLIGDNLRNSRDSREFGPCPRTQIVATVKK